MLSTLRRRSTYVRTSRAWPVCPSLSVVVKMKLCAKYWCNNADSGMWEYLSLQCVMLTGREEGRTRCKITFLDNLSEFRRFPRLRSFAFLIRAVYRWRERCSTGAITGREKPKHEEKNLSQCHLVRHRSRMNWPGIEAGLLLWVEQLTSYRSENTLDHIYRKQSVSAVQGNNRT